MLVTTHRKRAPDIQNKPSRVTLYDVGAIMVSETTYSKTTRAVALA
jgi:hypothetical protein